MYICNIFSYILKLSHSTQRLDRHVHMCKYNKNYVIGSEKTTLMAQGCIIEIAVVNGKLHNFIDYRIFPDFYSTVYCLQAVKILAPNSVPFRF